MDQYVLKQKWFLVSYSHHWIVIHIYVLNYFHQMFRFVKFLLIKNAFWAHPTDTARVFHVTLKQHRNDPFHVVSMQNTRGVFLGHPYIYDRTFLRKTLTNKHSIIDTWQGLLT